MPFETVCFISARNLGDAVMHAQFIKKLQEKNFSKKWIVWTSHPAAYFFESISDCEVICSTFPSGISSRQFLKNIGIDYFKAIIKLRKLKIDAIIDVIGDFREQFSSVLIPAQLRFSPKWSDNHPFLSHIRTHTFFNKKLNRAIIASKNIYAAHDEMIAALSASENSTKVHYPRGKISDKECLRIGIHPLASHPFKFWPRENWHALIALLKHYFPKIKFTMYGAPHESAQLQEITKNIAAEFEQVNLPLRDFRASLANMDILIGLDSISVHLAHSEGVPAIVLVGANDPEIYTPPTAQAVFSQNFCKYQPCSGKTECVGSDFEYICMKSIETQQVYEQVLKMIENKNSRNSQIALNRDLERLQ